MTVAGVAGSPPPPPLVEQRGRASLDAALLAAYRAGDAGALVRLYAQAADLAEAADQVDAACFYLTQAYVFALSAGASQADALHARLVAHGSEE